MEEKYHVIEGRYIDSVLLMQISREIEKIQGVSKASCMVATAENISFLEMAGFHPPSGVSANSVIIAVEAESGKKCEDAINNAINLIDTGMVQHKTSYTLDDLPDLISTDDFPVVFISTPGEYVFDVADKSLDLGANVHIFSSNVPIEQELRLKTKGASKGLFVMGPDCGTSIIQGKGLGFSNALQTSGDIGIIGSSGTGIQELSVLMDRNGLGVSYAIGVGSNDLKESINGIMSKQALNFLKERCSAIALVCKKPDPSVERALLESMGNTPSVFISLGSEKQYSSGDTYVTGNIDDAVSHLMSKIGKGGKIQQEAFPKMKEPGKERKLLRGFFVGGSLCYQAQAILHGKGVHVFSNAPADNQYRIEKDFDNLNVCIDTGAEEYVAGKPHPMIDPVSRNSFLVSESSRKDVRVILFDIILGYGSAEDPITGLDKMKNGPVLVASICGTEKDSQGYQSIRKRLEDKGVVVFRSAARAAEYAASMMR